MRSLKNSNFKNVEFSVYRPPPGGFFMDTIYGC